MDIARKNSKPDEFFQHFPVDRLPFFSMRLHFIPEFHKSDQVRQLMYKRDQEGIRIQIAIDADPVIAAARSMPVIPQDALPLPRDRQMNIVMIEVVEAQLDRLLGYPLPQIVDRSFFLRHFSYLTVAVS